MIQENLQHNNFHYLKLVELGEEYFNYNPKSFNDALTNIKEAVKFTKFKLPDDLDEYFIRYYQAPVFWIIDHPMVKYLEDFIIKNVKTNIDNFNLAKELYTKWTINRNVDEKKYIAASAARLIEKNQKDSCFLLNLYLAVILTYERSIYNPRRANELYESIVQEIETENLDEDVAKKLKYYVLIYWSFLYFTNEKFEDAKVRLQEAKAIYPNNYTAAVYLTVCEIVLGSTLSIRGSLNSIVELDLKRIKYAIDENNFKMFDYFVTNNLISAIFSFPNIWIIYEDFENILDTELARSEFSSIQISDKIKRIKNYPSPSYIQQEQWNVLSFYDKILEKYNTYKSFLYIRSTDFLLKKISLITESIVQNIKNSFSIDIEEKIKTYTIGIKEHKEQLEELKIGREEDKKDLREEEKKSIEKFEKRLKDEIETLEDRITNLHNVEDLNPRHAFQNAITIGIIIVLLVSMLGGFAGYSNSMGNSNGDISRLVSGVIMSGLKWGVIAGVLVVIYSVLAAGSVVLEKSNQRMKLIKKISDLKRMKDSSIDKIKQKYNTKEEELLSEYQAKIEEKEKTLNNYIQEKQQKENDYYKEVEDTINYEVDKFVNFISTEKQI